MNTEQISTSTPLNHLTSSRKKTPREPGAPPATPDSVMLEGAKARKGAQPSAEMIRDICAGSAGKLSNAHVKERTEALLQRQKEGTTEEILVNNDRHMHLITHGVPSYVKLFNHQGVTFRHYFREEAQKENALSMGALIAGPVAYARVSPCLRIDFPELTGVFLTLPKVKPEDVGVPGHGTYVDMTLPADTPVLEIEPGRIYLIAGEPKLPDWIVEHYGKYKAGETIPEYMIPTMKKIEARGGILEPTNVYFTPEKR